MKSLQQRFKDEHDRKNRKAPQMLTDGHYIYLDWSQVTTSTTERLATEP